VNVNVGGPALGQNGILVVCGVGTDVRAYAYHPLSVDDNEPGRGLPGQHAWLEQNFPNPFNPTTEIGYRIPVTGFVTLEVYDLLGREVATLVNAQMEAGIYTVMFDGAGLASGTYLYRLEVNGFVLTRRLMLVK
jgi:hypothetical protein